MKRPTPEEVEREIAALDGMDITALQNRWRELYRVEPPFKVRSKFLRTAVAYRLQEQLHGGLRPATKRLLRRIAEEARTNRPAPRGGHTAPPALGTAEAATILSKRIVLNPGTRLVREWAGRTEIVDVLASGFGWRGKTYRTLSAVAVAITGTKWSGPKFFGLLAKPKRVDTLLELTP